MDALEITARRLARRSNQSKRLRDLSQRIEQLQEDTKRLEAKHQVTRWHRSNDRQEDANQTMNAPRASTRHTTNDDPAVPQDAQVL